VSINIFWRALGRHKYFLGEPWGHLAGLGGQLASLGVPMAALAAATRGYWGSKASLREAPFLPEMAQNGQNRPKWPFLSFLR